MYRETILTALNAMQCETSKVLQASFIAEDGTLYASAFNTLYKSVDGGVTNEELRTFVCEGIDSIHVTKTNVILLSPGLNAAQSDAGLWRSSDGGLKWTKTLSLPVSSSIWAIDEDSHGTLFAGVYTRGPQRNARIYKSSDSGATWTQIYYDKKARHIHDIAVDKNSNTVYATIGDKYVPESNIAYIMRSDDYGKHWKKILEQLPQMVAIETMPGARLFGTDDIGNGQLYRTIDDKEFVKVLDTGAQSYCFWIRRDALNRKIYASFVSGEATHRTTGIYTSDDEGVNWFLFRSFKSVLPYEGSSKSSNFHNGTIYFSVRQDGNQKNGVRVTHNTIGDALDC